jgi:hypothetical protein
MGGEQGNTTSEGEGVGGDLFSDPHRVRADLQMVSRFPIRPEARGPIADAVALIALDKTQPMRIRLSAIRCAAQLDKLNMDQEAINAGRAPTDQQTGDMAKTLADVRRELWADEQYLDFLRGQSSQADRDTGPMGEDSDPGVEDVATPGDD